MPTFPGEDRPERPSSRDGEKSITDVEASSVEEAPSSDELEITVIQELVDEPELFFSAQYRGGEDLISAEVYEDHAEILFQTMSREEVLDVIGSLLETYPELLGQLACEVGDESLTVRYSDLSEETLDAYWRGLVSFMDERNTKEERTEVQVSLGEDKAFVYLTKEASEKVDEVITELYKENPEVFENISWSVDNDVLVIEANAAVEDAEKYLKVLQDRLSEPKEPVDSPVEKTEEVIEPVIVTEPTPVTKAGITIREKSAAAIATLSLGSQGVEVSANGRFEARILENFSVGAKVGLATGGKLSLLAMAKYDFETDIYAFGGLGLQLGIPDVVGAIMEVGVGYEYQFSERWSGFAEMGLRLTTTPVNPSFFASYGAKYHF